MPSANKKVINPDPVQLFTQFSTLTNKEFELLSNLKKADADRYLNKMFENESIGKFESKNGIIWISRLAALTLKIFKTYKVCSILFDF